MLTVIFIFLLLTLVIALLLSGFNKIFAVKEDPMAEKIDKLLPQTQCGQCGYPGCMPYAKAIVDGDAINKCIPGGQPLVEQIAELLNVEVPADTLEEPEDNIAIIDENTCIGCLHCIEACPVDAIIGSKKLMHVIIPDYCTGCELCLEPCPVKCISMIPRPKPIDEFSKIRQETNFPKGVNLSNMIKIANLTPDLAKPESTALSSVESESTNKVASKTASSITNADHPTNEKLASQAKQQLEKKANKLQEAVDSNSASTKASKKPTISPDAKAKLLAAKARLQQSLNQEVRGTLKEKPGSKAKPTTSEPARATKGNKAIEVTEAIEATEVNSTNLANLRTATAVEVKPQTHKHTPKETSAPDLYQISEPTPREVREANHYANSVHAQQAQQAKHVQQTQHVQHTQVSSANNENSELVTKSSAKSLSSREASSAKIAHLQELAQQEITNLNKKFMLDLSTKATSREYTSKYVERLAAKLAANSKQNQQP